MTKLKFHPSIAYSRLVEAIESDNYTGFCLACGAEVQDVEPDAEKYECPDCDAPAVYGTEQLLMMLPS